MATAGDERYGRYELRDPLGEGAMGIVYRAVDPELGRDVAIKVLHGWLLDETVADRFRREARALAKLAHPHIVTVFDAGISGSEPYIVMELVEGQSLASAIAGGVEVPFEAKVRAAIQLCDALACAHDAGVIHRDVKPGNILLSPQGAKLADFGIARHAGGTTATSELAGSPAYLAPEVFAGEPADERSDIYGLGTSLYEWLAGTRPYDATDIRVLAARVIGGDIPPLSDRWPACPPSLERFVHKALARDPAARYQTARAFGADLRAFLGEPSVAVETDVAVAVSDRRRRRGVVAVATAGAGALVVAGLVLTTGQDGQATAAPPLSSGTEPSVNPTAQGVDRDPGVSRQTQRTPTPAENVRTPPPVLHPPSVATGDDEAEEPPMPRAVPPGTILTVQIATELRTDRSLAGHEFTGVLAEPLLWGEQVVAARGTMVRGIVDDVDPGRAGSQPTLRLSLTALRLANRDVPLRTALYTVVAPPQASGRSLPVLILGAAVGALGGAALAGAEGAPAGGALGAALVPQPPDRPAPVVLTAPLRFKLAAALPLPPGLS